MRAERDFTALDVEINKLQAKAIAGILTTDEKAYAAAVEVERQKLRDAPAHPGIDAAQTVDELKTALQTVTATNKSDRIV